MRIEHDSLGAVEIPDNVWWGPQTERSRHNFTTGPKMPMPVIRSLIQVKLAAAIVNGETGSITPEISKAIQQAAKQLLALNDAQLAESFPLQVYQTGSGTQTNMNVNEVLAHLSQPTH
jgi:fumarate hydratase class II